MQKYEKLRSKRECKSYHNKFMRAPIRRVAILALQTNIHSLVVYCMTQQREGREEIRPAQRREHIHGFHGVHTKRTARTPTHVKDTPTGRLNCSPLIDLWFGSGTCLPVPSLYCIGFGSHGETGLRVLIPRVELMYVRTYVSPPVQGPRLWLERGE